METCTEEVSVIDYSEGNGDSEIAVPLTKFIDCLQLLLARIPEEYRDSAKFQVTTCGDYATAYLSIAYVRPKTPAELTAEAEEDARYRAQSEERERAIYERLSRKFGSQPLVPHE